MKSSTNVIKTSAAIALILMISLVAVLASSPVDAQIAVEQPVSGPLPSGISVDDTHDTISYLSFRPNPIGVGQQLLINMWINPSFASNHRFAPQAFKLTITDPDGDTDIYTLDTEPATAATWLEYVPDKTGEWKIKLEFLGTYFPAGQYYNGYIVDNRSGTEYGSAYYNPSSAAEETLTVQTDMVYSWPPAAFPTDYWERPASFNNREWWPILGNWPGTGYVGGGAMWDEIYPNTNPHDSCGRYDFAPWVQGPNTGHILWKRQDAIAGLIGGMAGIYGRTGYASAPNLIYAGRCYDTMTIPVNGVPTSCAVCYDLRTGEQYYAIPTADGGVTPSYIGYIAPGEDELATSTWSVELIALSRSGGLQKIDPLTGSVRSISVDLTSGTYYMNNYFLTLDGDFLINWTTLGTSSNFAGRIASNISWPFPAMPGQYRSATGMCAADFNVGIAAYVTRQYTEGSNIYWGINITAASLKTGELLPWTVSVTDETTYSASCIVADHGKIAVLTQNGYWLAYDLRTGQKAWQSERMDYPWGQPSFGAYAVQSAYGMLFRQSYDGIYAFNWTNGEIVWKYVAPSLASFESPYITDGIEHYPFNTGAYIADGKMYTYNTEHTPSYPRTRGWSLHCINITNGEGLWRMSGEQSIGAIADGYLVTASSWDGHMYVYGKGKSATTVSLAPKVITLGDEIVIEGTVLDMSPAQPGTPCVSPESMTLQMEYLHLQQPLHGLWGNDSVSGVTLSIVTVDPNNNYRHIGEVNTDGYTGTFGFTWEPDVPGQYEITAQFLGDDSYSSSMATTYVEVVEAEPTITPEPTPAPPDYTWTIIGTGIAVIIAVAIGIVLTLRKKE